MKCIIITYMGVKDKLYVTREYFIEYFMDGAVGWGVEGFYLSGLGKGAVKGLCKTVHLSRLHKHRGISRLCYIALA